MFQVVDFKLPADQSAFGLNWEMCVAEMELYGAVKFVLKEKCANPSARVPDSRVYELLHLLALKFDPVRLHL